MSRYDMESGSCPCLCPREHSQLSWGTASETELPHLLLWVPAYAGVYTLLVVDFLLLWELKTEGFFPHFCLLNSYQCLPFEGPIRKPGQRICKCPFQHTTFPSEQRKKLGQSESKLHPDYVDPSALYLSPLNIKEQGEVCKDGSHSNLHINVHQHFQANI